MLCQLLNDNENFFPAVEVVPPIGSNPISPTWTFLRWRLSPDFRISSTSRVRIASAFAPTASNSRTTCSRRRRSPRNSWRRRSTSAFPSIRFKFFFNSTLWILCRGRHDHLRKFHTQWPKFAPNFNKTVNKTQPSSSNKSVIRSKLECLYLAGLSNLVYFLPEKRQHIQVKHLSGALLYNIFLDLPTSIISCLPGTNTLPYYEHL